MLYSVILQDGRRVRKHIDQLRHHTNSAMVGPEDENDEIDLPLNGDAAVTESEGESPRPLPLDDQNSGESEPVYM